MEKNESTLGVLRHSTSHIMAQAVQKLFPNAKLAIGPSTDTGFYYDFDLTDGHAFTEEDLAKIEEEMKNIIKQNLTFERFEIKDVDAQIFDDAMFFVRTSIPTFIGVGINVIMSAYYTSIQRAGASAVVSILRSLALPIILIFILPNLFGYIGFMLVLPISEIITLIVALYLYRDRKADIIIV